MRHAYKTVPASVLCLLVLLLCCAAPALAAADLGADAERVKKTLDGVSLGAWRGAELYGGTAIVTGSQGFYWVKDGTVYAANGTAGIDSPRISTAPPSVDTAAIEAALAGSAPAMPAHFEWDSAAVQQGLKKTLEPAKMRLEAQGRKDMLPVSWKIVSPGGGAAECEIEEAGGMVRQLRIKGSITKDQKTRDVHNRPFLITMLAALALLLGEDEAHLKQILTPFMQVMSGKQDEVSAPVGPRAVGKLEAGESEKGIRSMWFTLTPVPAP